MNAAQQYFDDFYEDMFLEMAKYGEVEEIFVCRNLGDHLVGNVYVKVRSPSLTKGHVLISLLVF